MVIIQDHIYVNLEKGFLMGEIPLPTTRKDMIIKIIFTRPLTTATNVIVRTLPKIIRNPRFAGGVAKIANNQIQHIQAMTISVTLHPPHRAI